MRVALFLMLLLAGSALANHPEGKGARSLGGSGVPRGDALFTIESDTFSDRSVGSLLTDAAATQGRAWNLSTYGIITTTIELPVSGVVWFDIRARGFHPPDMRNTHMHILIDGVQRAEWDVRGEWLTYPQSVPMLAGEHEVSVDNFNNYRANVADRALIVDWLAMTTPTLDGSPRVPAGGSVKVDAADIQNSVTGQLERSSLANDGTQWLQWGVGCFAEMFVMEAAGEHALLARLRGNVHEDVGTRVQIGLDGRRVDEYHVGVDWEDRETKFSVNSIGPHLVEICYDNDEPGKKRNLWLDEMHVSHEGLAVPAGAASWPSAHGSLSNLRHAQSAINAQSVLTAREAWTYAASGPVTGTPAYDAGVLYFGDHKGKVHAVKASDGSAVWAVANEAGVDSSVALDDRRVYIGDQKGWLSARSRADGALVWRVRADPEDGTHLYGSPVLHDGVVYTGVASEQTLIEYKGEQTFRGSVAAFRASDGALLWRTHTQDPGGLGVSVWSTPAIDPGLGLLFVGTGNSYGEPVGKYTDSILALKLSDGAVVWSHQATKNDAFNARGGAGPDRDFGASPLLFEAGGRKLVGDGDKGGSLFALDRATGELVWTAKVDFRVDGVAASQLEGFVGTASYHEGVIYAPTTARSMVHAIDASTGAIKWATELNPLPREYGRRMFGASTAAEDVVLQGNAFGNVYALEMSTGRILTNLSVGGTVQGGITLAGDRFFVPHVGANLWSGSGGVRAFVVDADGYPPTVPPTVWPTVTPTGTPTWPPPTEHAPGPGSIAESIPGLGVLALVSACVIATSLRARRR